MNPSSSSLAGAHVQEADVLAAHLAGELGAEVDPLRPRVGAQADAAAEERLHLLGAQAVAAGAGEVEERGAVEEEVAPLGKEEGEAREVDLALIDLGLREVGVDRQVGAQAGRRVVEEVDAGVLHRGPSRLRPRPGADSVDSRPYGLMSRPLPCVTSLMPLT